MSLKVCRECGKEFKPKNATQVYCSVHPCGIIANRKLTRAKRRSGEKYDTCECGKRKYKSKAKCFLCNQKLRYQGEEVEELTEKQARKQVFTQRNGVEYYGRHGLIAKPSNDNWQATGYSPKTYKVTRSGGIE